MPSLYIVATPIGNLEDISLRALRILGEVKLIAAEDTRKTKRLLVRYNIRTPVTSYHEHSKLSKLDYILGCLEGGDVALVSDAGMPGMSDPGYELVVAASQRGIPIIPIPGPSIIVTALAVSGLPTEKFIYLGFLPRKTNSRRRLLESVADEYGTIVVLESPHRLLAALNDILLTLGDRKMAVCREAIAHFTEPRGEFTLVIEGKAEKDKPQLTEDVEKQLHHMRLSGMMAKEAIAQVAGETGLPRKELYRAWLRLG